MLFRAVGRRCAVDLDSWNLPFTSEQILDRLHILKYIQRETDISKLATSLVRRASYRRSASVVDAPAVFDCSSFTKWLYAQRGIWIPRRCLHQFAFGNPSDGNGCVDGDLVFRAGSLRPPIHPSVAFACHVGIVVGSSVIHAQPFIPGGIVSDPLESWLHHPSWHGVRRIVPSGRRILTLDIPPTSEIETSDDICWHLLESMDWSSHLLC